MKAESEPRGPAEIIRQACTKGEISLEDSQSHVAILVSNTLHDHELIQYPHPSQTIKKYLELRLSSRGTRDPFIAVKNGEWIQNIVRIRTRNYHEYDMLMWAGRLCKKLGTAESCTKIREAVFRHIHADENYPREDFQRAIDVQLMDSLDRRNNI